MDGPDRDRDSDSGIDHGARLPLSKEQVARVLYASQSNIGDSVYAEMELIRAAAMRHNPTVGVCTALLYQSGWFVQWKEGPAEALQQLMERVAADKRHHSLRVVHSSRGPRLLAGPWSMAIVQRTENAGEMTQRVLRLRHGMENGTQCEPSAAWRQLSTPLPAPLAARLSDPDAFQRVLVCASTGVASFELLRWLAFRSGQEIVHRRFAGSHERDVGTDLIDFFQAERVLRVVAMARGGLTLPLTCALMTDYSHVVLLLCGTPGQNMNLVHKVALASSGLVCPPVLIGVAAHGADNVEPASKARRLGLTYIECQAEPTHYSTTWDAIHPLLERQPEPPAA